MSVAEMLPSLRELSRADKLRVMQFLVQELAQEETLLQTRQSYAVWSPYDAHDAAHSLLAISQEEERLGAFHDQGTPSPAALARSPAAP